MPVLATTIAGAAPAMVRLGRLAQPAPPKGSTRIGPVSESQPIGFEIILAPSHPEELASLLHSLYARGSSEYHQWLTSAQFAQRFDPAPVAISQVEEWLAGKGVRSSYRSGFAIRVSEPAKVVESALGVSLEDYRLAAGQQVHVANGAPLLPTTLAASVVSVVGLDSAPRLSSQLTQQRSTLGNGLLPHDEGVSPCAAATSAAGGSAYTPDQVGAAYGIGSLTAAGQTGTGREVAVYELGQHIASDIDAYETCFGLQDPVSTFAVDGGGTAGAAGTAEADADIEQVATQAPGTSIVSYEGPNTTMGNYDTWQAIVSQDTADVVSTSYGLCEPDSLADGFVNAEDLLFQEAAAQGQTIVAASGDSGSEDCYPPSGNTDTSLQVDFPASDPYVTAVGGTTLLPGGGQSAWNDCEGQTGASCADTANAGAGGGGISRQFDRPSWQPLESEWSTNIVGNSCDMDCRDVPDVSANAGTPEMFYVEGAWSPFAGTSIAAPLLAGIVADTSEGCAAGRQGVVASVLYALVGEGLYGAALTDVVGGDNDLTRSNSSQYTAVPGYDPATGLGTPIAGGWSCPQVTSVSPAQAQPGAEVTVAGLALDNAAITFGSTPAHVISSSASSATVVVPSDSGTVSVGASNPVGIGTSTRSFTFTPSSTSGYDLVGQDGGVFVFPTEQPGGFFGSLPGLGVHVNDIAGMVPSPDDRGYFLVGRDGGVFSFGDAPFLGSLPGLHVAVNDIRGIVPTRDNRGYFLVGRDGGVFAFGDAPFLGSLPGEGIHISDVTGMAATPSDLGYWLVSGNGTVYAFGDAPDFGSATGTPSPVSGIAATPDGGGYRIVTQNGSVYDFGDAGYFLCLPAIGVSPTSPVIGLVPTADDEGYWLIGSDGGIFAFGDAPFVGSLPGLGIHVKDIVGAVPTTL